MIAMVLDGVVVQVNAVHFAGFMVVKVVVVAVEVVEVEVVVVAGVPEKVD